jgi:hypothetical protein
MSGRSGYRKTDRKRNRNATPGPKFDYVLRFQLPNMLAAFIAPGQHGWGVAVGYNDTVFAEGRSPLHCCELAARFFEKISAGQHAQRISATIPIAARVVKLLPCSAHCSLPKSDGFKKLGVDLEAIHDRVSRFADQSRHLSIDISADAIIFKGGYGWKFGAVHLFVAGRTRQPS